MSNLRLGCRDWLEHRLLSDSLLRVHIHQNGCCQAECGLGIWEDPDYRFSSSDFLIDPFQPIGARKEALVLFRLVKILNGVVKCLF